MVALFLWPLNIIMRIVIETLVDITKSGVKRKGQGDDIKLAQQSNFNTMQQVINMRSLINENSDPFVTTKDITGQFGSKYKGEHKVWTYEFTIDRDSVYATAKDDAGLLKDDFQGIPIIGGLTETVSKPSTFKVKGTTDKNTLIQIFDK